MVSSSERMLYGVLGNTTNLGPAVTLNSILVVCISSLKKRLVGTSTSCNNSNLSTYSRGNSLLTSRGKTKTGGSFVLIVRYNNSEASRSTSECTTVTNLSFNVAHDGTFGNRAQRENVSASKSGLLSAVHILSSVHTFGTKHELIVPLVTVCVHKLNLSNRGSTTRIVHDLLHDTLDVTMLLGVVNSTKLNSSLAGPVVGVEDGRLTPPLCLKIQQCD
jgi:hypothetical protein